MDLKLRGKVVVITGASRGIGRAAAGIFAEEGARLVLAARSRDLLELAASQTSGEVLTVADDLRHADAPGRLIDAAMAHFGRIDVLVNNAGATRRGSALELGEEDWQDGFALKFYGAVRCSRAAWPHLKAAGGSIVNTVGVGGRTASADFAIGGAVNAALLNLTKSLAALGTRDGVRVNAANPGSIATERLERRVQSLAVERNISVEAAAQAMANRLGVDRFGTPAEAARVIAFLASPAASYCHGAIVDVDGGQTRTL